MTAQNPLPTSAPESASPQPIDGQPAAKKNRGHVVRPLYDNPLPTSPVEPLPHEPNALELKTPKVTRPAEVGPTRFVLPGNVPD